MAHIIVAGNEKGGSGKSTTAIHVATALARMGWHVGALDMDLRQRSFRKYVENRRAFIQQQGVTLPCPDYHPLTQTAPEETPSDDTRLNEAVGHLRTRCDFIVIDCPGAHTPLAKMAHALADTLVTPLYDSFVDVDLFAQIDPDRAKVLGPSAYAQMIWQARRVRACAGHPPIDWIVLRNRLGPRQIQTKHTTDARLDDLACRIGFRTAPGVSERPVYRDLFSSGLTLLDLKDLGATSLEMSHIAARQELRDLMRALALPGVDVTF
ncbi:AAA family ATPase [Rhodobacteraceae bacterium]|nr:AAA family ATPase [Paracoccaceae bacterium]